MPFEPITITAKGPPIADQTQMIFGAYLPSQKVTSIELTELGVDVHYENGGRYFFAAIPEGHNLVMRPDGKIAVCSDDIEE